MYRELLVQLKPTVLIEIGNRFGGSALCFADLFDTIGLYPAKVIAVVIDHSDLFAKPRSYPRITWRSISFPVRLETFASTVHLVHVGVLLHLPLVVLQLEARRDWIREAHFRSRRREGIALLM